MHELSGWFRDIYANQVLAQMHNPKTVLEHTNPNSITVEAYFAHRWNGLSLTCLACWLRCLLRSCSNNYSQMEHTAQSLEWPAPCRKLLHFNRSDDAVLCNWIMHIMCTAHCLIIAVIIIFFSNFPAYDLIILCSNIVNYHKQTKRSDYLNALWDAFINYLSAKVYLLGQPLCKAGMGPVAKHTINWGIRNPEKFLITAVIHIPHRLCSEHLWAGDGAWSGEGWANAIGPNGL